MIQTVVKFDNEMVVVFDKGGEQSPEYQGRYNEVRAKILAHAPQSAKFFHGDWPVFRNPLPRKDW